MSDKFSELGRFTIVTGMTFGEGYVAFYADSDEEPTLTFARGETPGIAARNLLNGVALADAPDGWSSADQYLTSALPPAYGHERDVEGAIVRGYVVER